jgi:glutathione S-transferase
MGAEVELIYHTTRLADWQAAVRRGSYALSTIGRTVAEEGFIHASFPSQVQGVLDRYYQDVEDPLVLLHIATAAVVGLLRIEPAASGERFPHVYGELPVAAVVVVEPLARVDDGQGAGRWRWAP